MKNRVEALNSAGMTEQELEQLYTQARRSADRPPELKLRHGARWWVIIGMALLATSITYALVILAPES